MNPYRTYKNEMETYFDRVTGVKVTRLTDYMCHSVQPYFTQNGWYDNDTKFLFTSQRHNAVNIHSIDINTGVISQLTDIPEGHRQFSAPNDVNRFRNETYYLYNGCVYALDLKTLETRPLWIVPKGFNAGGMLVGGDGNFIYCGVNEDLSSKIYTNLGASYIGFQEMFEAKPLSRIYKVSVDGDGAQIVWEEKNWVGHVNPSNTKANLITFCHEGPWNLVDNRIWLLDVDTGKVTAIRKRRVPGQMIGHEYWFLDGEHIGYQVHTPNAGSSFGFVKYDGTGEIEADCKKFDGPDHIHSNNFDLVVADSGTTIHAYRYNGKTFDEPRILCMHDSCFHHQNAHPHPRMTPDGKGVTFNSDERGGYTNIYIAYFPDDITTLPVLTGGK